MKKLYLIVTGAGLVVTAPFLIWLFWYDMIQAYRRAAKDIDRLKAQNPNVMFDPGSDFWKFISVEGGSRN